MPEDRVGDCILPAATVHVTLGLRMLDMGEIALAGRDNEDVILLDIDIEDEG